MGSNLANMLLKGQGGPKGEAKARGLFAKAFAAGDPDATYNLALMLREGERGPKDEAKARDKVSDAVFGGERGSRVPSLLLVARVASHNAGNIHT